jgi:hypothetical protein
MWLGEPVLILAISATALGVLFAIRRILARAPVESSSDRTASDVRDSRGIAGVIAPPPLIFLGFLALAAVLEAIIPTPTTALFPYVRYVAGTVPFVIGLVIGSPAYSVCVLPVPTSRPICLQRHWWSTASTVGRATRSIWR